MVTLAPTCPVALFLQFHSRRRLLDAHLVCTYVPQTLISVCFRDEANKLVMEKEVSTELIAKFIQNSEARALESEQDSKSETKLSELAKYNLEQRFPRVLHARFRLI